MYFYNSKVFGLRAKYEHADHMAEQYTFGTEQDGRTWSTMDVLPKTSQGDCTANRQLLTVDIPGNERCIVDCSNSICLTYLTRVVFIGGPWHHAIDPSSSAHNQWELIPSGCYNT